MALQFTTSYLEDSLAVLGYYKKLAERAMDQVADEQLFVTLDSEGNSIAIIVKHMVGNMRSRWTDFLTTDGEKPDRNRDSEFEEPPATRAALLAFSNDGVLIAATGLAVVLVNPAGEIMWRRDGPASPACAGRPRRAPVRRAARRRVVPENWHRAPASRYPADKKSILRAAAAKVGAGGDGREKCVT